MAKLFRIRTPKLRITPKGIRITKPTARIGGKVGVNLSSSGVSGSANTPLGTISTGRAHRKNTSDRASAPATKVRGLGWYLWRLALVAAVLFVALVCLGMVLQALG